jgi:hypothetical protein
LSHTSSPFSFYLGSLLDEVILFVCLFVYFAIVALNFHFLEIHVQIKHIIIILSVNCNFQVYEKEKIILPLEKKSLLTRCHRNEY